VPLRARYIRAIMLEIERIHSHLLWLGIAGHILGFDTVLMQAWRIREPIMWLAEEITGNRKSYGLNLVGGVRRDIPQEKHPKILAVVDRIEAEAQAVIDAVVGDTTLLMRLKGVGVLKNEDARKYCVVGPTARGSGLDIDARRDHPYAAYDRFAFKVPVMEAGDSWARTLVRLEELLESIKMVRQGLKEMPEGELMAEVGEIAPFKQAVSTVEAPRGECLHYVLTGQGNQVYRWRVRAPSYQNLQTVPAIIMGGYIADVPIAIGSLDPCFSCTERFEVVDVKTKKIKVYSQKELMAFSR